MSTRGRALVTGGAGFLGSHLCERLLGEGFELICFDNLLTGTMKNVEHLVEHPRFAFVNADVTKPIEIDASIDIILHFASPASPKDYTSYPIHTLKVGALGTYHALGLAKAKGACFILASSSEVYGDPLVNPQPESYSGNVNPVGPRSMYDEAKRFAEALSVAYARTHELRIGIVRIFNTYGPRMRLDDGRALPTFIVQALRHEPITVYGDGSQTRSFCYVDDLIEGVYRIVQLLESADSKLPGSSNPGPAIFNIGSPDEVSILKIAQEVVTLTASRSQIVFSPLPPDDPRVRCPDISRASKILGWRPQVDRWDGLNRMTVYFRQRLAMFENRRA